MILGLIAGRWMKASSPDIPYKKFVLTGTLCLAAAALLHFAGICPIVKRIWTPSWTLFSGGICFFFLSAISWLIDSKGYRKPAFPLIVIGRNSIAAYLIAELCRRSSVNRCIYISARARFNYSATLWSPSCSG